MSSNRITAAEATKLASQTEKPTSESILNQVYEFITNNPSSGKLTRIFNPDLVSLNVLETVANALVADGYQANAGIHTPTTLKLEIRWPA
ncbi:hypothetical protein [Acinetobacter baumannii]|uniref:hypothetical protein n=1 Tax=Acinetobacter baumannii TaxID=470 RepID=UPI000C6FFCEE|nr:hypothetical protein [Acinetobacter baumannii]MDH2562946.1 hypothetical protein [Acinetobacter baumannii]PST50845.1 hypothetical protein CV950_019450 [Acinetobacter baumannii]